MKDDHLVNAQWDEEQDIYRYKCKICKKWFFEDRTEFYVVSFLDHTKNVAKDQFFHKECFETLTSPDIVEHEF